MTGTLLLPFPSLPIGDDDRLRLHALERDLWWNPQRHLDDGAPPARELAEEKSKQLNKAYECGVAARRLGA